jgi:hypothetical protein
MLYEAMAFECNAIINFIQRGRKEDKERSKTGSLRCMIAMR